jgi:stage II sporulation protein D
VTAVGSELDLFAQRQQTASRLVRVTARDGGPADFTLGIPSKLDRRYRGVLQITAGAGTLSAVVHMDLETAVASAVAAEMPAGTPEEALKALAVLARSYYYAARGRHASFDFCDTTHCQFHRARPESRSPASHAARATQGLILSVGGKVFAAMYSASCGGRTQAAGGAGPYAYVAVECPACLRDAPVWERRLQFDTARELLENPSESARLRVVRELGWSAVPGNLFTATREGAEIVLRGQGEGHGMGVCQRGAIKAAADGADFRTILLYYLPGASLSSQKP